MPEGEPPGVTAKLQKDQLKHPETSGHYERIITRISEETDYFREFEQMGLLPGLKDGFRNFQWGRAKIKWGAFNLLYHLADTSPDRKPHGHYSASKNQVSIYLRKPKTQDIIRQIASNGELTEPLKGLIHEATHAFQIPPHTSKDAEREFIRQRRLLMETQAFLNHINFGSSEELMAHVAAFYPGDVGKQRFSARVVMELRALGFTIPEIGKFIENCGDWDSQTESYPAIDQKIDNKKSELNMGEEDLNGIIANQHSKRNEDKKKAKEIAVEELAH